MKILIFIGTFVLWAMIGIIIGIVVTSMAFFIWGLISASTVLNHGYFIGISIGSGLAAGFYIAIESSKEA